MSGSDLRAVLHTKGMADIWASDVDWSAVHARFEPPLELLQPLPRRVARREKPPTTRERLIRGCLSFFLAPMFLLGALMTWWGGLAALILVLGVTTLGTVTTRESGDGRDSTYFLGFRFRASGGNHKGEWQVPVARWRQTRIGDPVKVRYFPFAPGLRPIIEDGISPWVSILAVAPLGVLIAGVAGLSLLGFWAPPDGKNWVRRGRLAPAFITRRDDDYSRLVFLLRDENGRVYEVHTRVGDSTAFDAGAVETALYLPGQPDRARLYRALGWKAVLPQGRR